jgi:uncharacterized protein (DUF2147 family)
MTRIAGSLLIVSLFLCALLPVQPGRAYAGGPEIILGTWFSEDKTSKIEVVRCGEEYCGDVVWLEDPVYPPDAKEGVPGTPYLDHNNPKAECRSAPLLGLRIMKGFRFADDVWSGGTIYDPKNGKTYQGKMTLGSPTRLDLRGYVGIPLFGRTSHWTRESP